MTKIKCLRCKSTNVVKSPIRLVAAKQEIGAKYICKDCGLIFWPIKK